MSKRVFQHPPETTGGRKYWRSLGQLADTPEFRGWLEREFPQGASEINGSEVTRRSFLNLMGASAALAGLSLAGCRRPEKHLVPFTRGAEWSIPGKALFFSTSMPTRRGYSPLVATTYDGRPTKIEGNPLHPVSKGATGLYEQASILDLYDPDRVRHFTQKGAAKTAAEFEKAMDELIAGSGDGDGLAFLLEENNSPTRERLRLEIEKKFPKAVWAVYEPVGPSSEAGDAAFGAGSAANADFAKADVILALDSDFLGQEGDTADARAFASRRKVDGDNVMNRLYVVENRYTVTGGMADHRLRIPASQIGAALLELASLVGAKVNDAALNAVLGGAPKLAGTLSAWLGPCAEDLLSKKGKSLVLVGERQPAAVRALAYSINAALGNIGTTVTGARAYTKPAATIAQLAQQLGDKKIKALVILGGNPVYNAPADLDFGGKLKALGEAVTVVNVTLNPNETTPAATWQAPLAHYLESWGDGYARDGSYVSVQPMILPLFGGWSEHDILAKFAGQPKPAGPELIKETFRQIAKPADFATAWPKLLHDGFVPVSSPVSLTLAADAVGTLVKDKYPQAVLNGDAFEIVLIADASVDDGRYANNGWLQEFPDPITKLTWDNAAQISPKSAKKLGIDESGEIVEITIDKVKVEIPVIISPGHADNSLSIPLGYGRTAAGRVGTVAATTEKYVFSGDIISGGFNAYPLTTSAESYIRVGAKVRAVGRSYRLAVTQEHGSLEGRGADLLREGTVETYKANPEFAQTLGMDAHIPPNRSLYKHPPLGDEQQWGMTVDLNACVGCGTCMVACQAENNIPIVGKRQVIDGREMHWIRCDRYFASGPAAEHGDYDQDVDEPEMVSQPIMCQHCENAPCETVCPVNATVHSEDGINVMAYNRCIGTRYCANNCPFKVRRFNFFDYNQRQLDHLRKWNLISEKGMEETLKMSKNPNVTVRMRGVMEKCTFCVQRVQEAKIAAKAKGRGSADVKIPTDSFTVACAQTCPTEAIVFGDIKDPESAVSKVRASARAYELLKYLNINTRVLYLARIRNPNDKMPDAKKVAAYIKTHHGSHAPEGENTKNGGAH
jgi:MoCo/4Fe-4S cofactor protein with predicted Tat translocation signal